MNRKTILAEIKKFFSIEELVCRHTFKRYGEQSWRFLDTEFLHCLLVIRRDILKSGMYCNNWDSGGDFSQRGLRCNLCQIVQDKTKKAEVYISAHVNGAGGDFTIKGMSAEEARKKIIANQTFLPYPIRLEIDVSWLHFDCYDYNNGAKINFFSV